MDITRKGREEMKIKKIPEGEWKEIKGVGKFPEGMYKEGMEYLEADQLAKIDDWSIIKYFKPHEFSCKCGKCHGQLGIDFELVLALDHMREIYGHPITINSGYRCDEHEETKKNPKSSHHVGGRAVDVSAKTSRIRYQLLHTALQYDIFQRIGIGKDFLHFDLDPDKDQMVAWLY